MVLYISYKCMYAIYCSCMQRMYKCSLSVIFHDLQIKQTYVIDVLN